MKKWSKYKNRRVWTIKYPLLTDVKKHSDNQYSFHISFLPSFNTSSIVLNIAILFLNPIYSYSSQVSASAVLGLEGRPVKTARRTTGGTQEYCAEVPWYFQRSPYHL